MSLNRGELIVDYYYTPYYPGQDDTPRRGYIFYRLWQLFSNDMRNSLSVPICISMTGSQVLFAVLCFRCFSQTTELMKLYAIL